MLRIRSIVVSAAIAAIVMPTAAYAEPVSADHTVTLPLSVAIDELAIADESRDGYQRREFPHWVDADRDGCNTRKEVLIEEVRGDRVINGCDVESGTWRSYYDGLDVTDSSKLDIDHMVPLAEAWDSGASAWTRDERRAYANDLGDSRSLLAVTASTNRSKGDKDPGDWLPPSERAHCRYIAEWVTVKLRWGLTMDTVERDAVIETAAHCEDVTITVTRA